MNIFKRPNALDKIPRDKLLHFAIGVVAYIPIYIIFLYLIPDSAVQVSLTAVIAIGILIEAFQDATKTGALEAWDAIAVALGGLCMAITSLL